LLWRDNGGGRLADKVRPEAVEAKAKQAVAEFQAHKQAQTAYADLLAKSWTRRRMPTFRTPLKGIGNGSRDVEASEGARPLRLGR